MVYGNYATLLGIPWSANMGRFADARKYCEKSVAMARELSRTDPQNATARYDLAISLARLGMVEPSWAIRAAKAGDHMKFRKS